MRASYRKHVLKFKRPSGTSRGILNEKETWFLIVYANGKHGIGECGILRGLSFDDVPDYEEKLEWTCKNIHLGKEALFAELKGYPSIRFGLEQALLSLKSPNPFELFPSDFTRKEVPIPINGLIWMGDKDFMLEQIKNKLDEGFDCLKMKIGAIDFDTELEILATIRSNFSKNDVELRVDANGAFTSQEAGHKLNLLAKYELHSIEQPIKPGNFGAMQQLCRHSPVPIALDEELIGIEGETKKVELLQNINPQYIILKPSLIGGFKSSLEWIGNAEKLKIGWWVTSALESNIGLNAISQWTYTLGNKMPQGLGTGGLYTNNFESPLQVKKGHLFYRKGLSWQPELIQKLCT
ncbi:o-succinylbenzoate synthase [Allomuricauda sp. SCSIO 65647]|uniref:o-succinylbenzoate synthase n=1 Tax=Allomuricauda sp. SCSIO 65647 TaxID=2908843 RepID=UPI001F4130A7|nr:o-succinylbenzoate synthase [Muricauda sp. SCSIO 65647]UJH67130.1 o-succinylbenzoate synthase [Muricauda sp. SCSIO 65647]